MFNITDTVSGNERYQAARGKQIVSIISEAASKVNVVN
jgi:hypothetical protein